MAIARPLLQSTDAVSRLRSLISSKVSEMGYGWGNKLFRLSLLLVLVVSLLSLEAAVSLGKGVLDEVLVIPWGSIRCWCFSLDECEQEWDNDGDDLAYCSAWHFRFRSLAVWSSILPRDASKSMWLSIDESVVIGVADLVVDDSDDGMIELVTVVVTVDVIVFVTSLVNGMFGTNAVSTQSLVRGRIN